MREVKRHECKYELNSVIELHTISQVAEDAFQWRIRGPGDPATTLKLFHAVFCEEKICDTATCRTTSPHNAGHPSFTSVARWPRPKSHNFNF